MTIKFHSMKPQTKDSGHSMDVADFYASGQIAGPSDDPAGQHSVGTPWHDDETPHDDPEQTWDATPGASRQGRRQGQGQIQGQNELQMTQTQTPLRQDLLWGLATIRLTNDSNWCYSECLFHDDHVVFSEFGSVFTQSMGTTCHPPIGTAPAETCF